MYNDPKQLVRPLCKEANLSSGAFQKQSYMVFKGLCKEKHFACTQYFIPLGTLISGALCFLTLLSQRLCIGVLEYQQKESFHFNFFLVRSTSYYHTVWMSPPSLSIYSTMFFSKYDSSSVVSLFLFFCSSS